MSDPHQSPKSTTKEKLRRLLIRSIPGTIPWVGEVWKDIVDEFSESEVEEALRRLENFAQADAETQRKLLIEVLKLKEIAGTSERFFHQMELREKADHVLHFLLENNFGNARFLFQMSQSPEGQRIIRDIDFEFRKAYPALLDKWADDMTPDETFPFSIITTAQAVGFPEGFESYASLFRNPELKHSSVPRLIEAGSLETDGEKLYIEGAKVVELPELPLHCGFIHEMVNGLPTDVRNEPSDRFWNAFYWVQPTGLRMAAMGLGVANPLEARFGISLWWDHAESRPFFTTMIVQEDTPEVRTQNRDIAIKKYGDLLRYHSQKR